MLVDTQARGNKRKITAFIGGLDLCDGRYDTPEHRLFKDLDTVFQNDYHNPTFSVSSFVLACSKEFALAESLIFFMYSNTLHASRF